MSLEIKNSLATTFTRSKYINGILQVPSALTTKIYSNGGSLLATYTSPGTATIAADGVMSFTMPNTLITTNNRNYKIQWTFVIGTITYDESQLFDTVQTPLSNNVSDEDLFYYIPDMRNKLMQQERASTSIGTVSTVVDDSPVINDKDYTGGYIVFLIGNTTTHEARITVHSRSTKTLTFSPAYSAIIAAGTKYIIRSSYGSMIQMAFNDYVMRDIRAQVGAAAGYIDGDKVKLLTIYKTLELYCRGAREELGDRWSLLADDYAKFYTDTLNSFSEGFDSDADGNISDTEEKERPSFNSIKLVR